MSVGHNEMEMCVTVQLMQGLGNAQPNGAEWDDAPGEPEERQKQNRESAAKGSDLDELKK